jgi:hypothetical protein
MLGELPVDFGSRFVRHERLLSWGNGLNPFRSLAFDSRPSRRGRYLRLL